MRSLVKSEVKRCGLLTRLAFRWQSSRVKWWPARPRPSAEFEGQVKVQVQETTISATIHACSIRSTIARFWIIAHPLQTSHHHHVSRTRLGRSAQHSASRPQRLLPPSQEHNTFTRTTNLPYQCFDYTSRASTSISIWQFFQRQQHISSSTRNAAKRLLTSTKQPTTRTR
jgi:hypothetical protein